MKKITPHTLRNQKHYSSRSVKGLIMLFLLTNAAAFAQTANLGSGTEVSASGTGDGLGPISAFYTDIHYQVVYTAAEIIEAGGAAGIVSQFGFNISTPTSRPLPNYRVSLGHTTATNSETHNTSITTQIYGGTFTPVEGYNMLTATAPFVWNGTDSILVDICYSGASYLEPLGQVYVYGNAAGSSRYIGYDYEEVCNIATSTVNTFKPQARFVFATPPSCLPPASVSTLAVTETTASVLWNPATDGAIPVGYEYAIVPVNNVPASGTFVTGLSANVEGLLPATTYYVFVRTICNGVVTDWTTTTFTTQGTMGAVANDLPSLSYYPNPVNDVLTITNASPITFISVYNLLGQQVITEQPNATSIKLNTAVLSGGTYLVKATTASGAATIKVVKK